MTGPTQEPRKKPDILMALFGEIAFSDLTIQQLHELYFIVHDASEETSKQLKTLSFEETKFRDFFTYVKKNLLIAVPKIIEELGRRTPQSAAEQTYLQEVISSVKGQTGSYSDRLN